VPAQQDDTAAAARTTPWMIKAIGQLARPTEVVDIALQATPRRRVRLR